LHEVWALAQGTQLREKESGFRYTPTTCFETFPFPEPTDTQREAIAAAAKELDTLRTGWLNPPEWTRTEVLEFPGSVDGPWKRYIADLPLPPGEGRGEGALKSPKQPLPLDLLEFARELRKTQTDEEKFIWSLLRNRRLAACKFRRQHPLEPYVLDFYCHEKKLAIELDGGQHNTEKGRSGDQKRTRFIETHGIRVLRFWNHDVLQDTEAVLQAIWNALHADQGALAPNPSPKGRGEPAIATVRYPRIVPKDEECARELKKRTLTNLYNQRPTWLDLAHKKLDAAVFAAYGWDPAISDDALLASLLALNLERAKNQ
jgi:very-short-patch-repair endonuclease